MRIEVDQEDDGRWIAEIPELAGVMVYDSTRDAAISKAKALALRVLADRLEHGEEIPELQGVFAFHDRDEIGPKMLARVARRTGLAPTICRTGSLRRPKLWERLTYCGTRIEYAVPRLGHKDLWLNFMPFVPDTFNSSAVLRPGGPAIGR